MSRNMRVGAVVSICLGLLVLAGASAVFAQATTVGPTLPVLTNTESLTTDVAFEPVHNMYLVVAGRGYGMLRGAFVSPSGTTLSTFPIGEQKNGVDPFFEAPRVSYCPDYAAFLVVWTNGYPATDSRLWARGIGANADGTPNYMTPQFNVETGIVKAEQPAVAYSPTSKEFLIAYTMDRTYELRVRRISLTTGVHQPVTIAQPAEYPSVGYNSNADEFLVAYRYEPDVRSDIQAVRVQPVSGAILGGPISVAGLNPNVLLSQPDVQFDPSTSRYFVTWWQQAANGGQTFGRFLNADGSDAGAHLLIDGAGSYDCLANARNPVDGTYFVTTCYTTQNEVYGVRVNADGSVTQPLFQVTSSGALHGAFGSRVAANATQPGWLVTVAIDQSWIAGQLIGMSPGAASVKSAAGISNPFLPPVSNRPSATPRTGNAKRKHPFSIPTSSGGQ